MNGVDPHQRAEGEAAFSIPRVAEIDLPPTLVTPHWPPCRARALALEQSWRPMPEPLFQPTTVWLAASAEAFLIFAELTDREARTSAAADHERIWERGDAFEIFIQSFGGDAYFEFQIAPNGHLLQLHYPTRCAPRQQGIDRYIRRDQLIEANVHVDARSGRWRVAARLPVAPLLPSRAFGGGAEWRMAFCRYDYEPDGRFCLSSSARLTRPDFHRIGEWSRISAPGGFAPASLRPAPATLA